MIEKWKKILSFKHLVKVDKGGMNWGGVGKISEWWNTHSDIMEQRKTHTHTNRLNGGHRKREGERERLWSRRIQTKWKRERLKESETHAETVGVERDHGVKTFKENGEGRE